MNLRDYFRGDSPDPDWVICGWEERGVTIGLTQKGKSAWFPSKKTIGMLEDFLKQLREMIPASKSKDEAELAEWIETSIGKFEFIRYLIDKGKLTEE